MKAPLPIQDLVAEMVHHHPSAEFRLRPLPSGVCFLWVELNGREFVIEHNPKRGTGVSENFPDTPMFVGHDEAFASLDEAIVRFKSLLADAALHGAPSQTAFAMHDKPISQ